MLVDEGAITLFQTAHAHVCALIDRFERYAHDTYLLPGYSEFQTAHAHVCALIDRFERYAHDTYLLPGYSEAAVRKDFIDPFLKALGWDVDHEREHNPTNRKSRSSAACRSIWGARKNVPQEANVSGHAKEIAIRKCAALDRQIDALVYELYGLTAGEIALVEGHVAPAVRARLAEQKLDTADIDEAVTWARQSVEPADTSS